MTELIREVDEALARDRTMAFARRWANLALILSAAVILAVAGYSIWHRAEEKQHGRDAEIFVRAGEALQNGKKEEGEKLLKELTASDSGYGPLAHLRLMALYASENRMEDAKKEREALGSQGFAFFGELGKLLAAKDLETLSRDQGPLSLLAKELLAIQAVNAGERQKASELYTEIVQDSAAPPALAARAKRALESLKSE